MNVAARFLGLAVMLLAVTACGGASSSQAEPPAEVAAPAESAGPEAADSDLIITHPVDGMVEAAVTEASFTGEPGAYQVSVTVTSPDTGCDQYADWWEVISADGELIYRRILAHSHVDEQPFTRSGGPVAIAPTDLIFIRVHMNNTGYSSQVLQGTVADGLRTTTLLIDPNHAADVASQPPQPSGCAF